MKNKKLGIDIDMVLRDLTNQLVKVYKKYYPTHEVVPLEKWDKYELGGYFPIGYKIKCFFFHEHPEEIYLQAKIYDGALEFMRELKRKENDITVVSSQPTKYLEHLTKGWLHRNEIHYDHYLFTEDKSEFKGDLLLDDYTGNLVKVLDGKNAVPVCFNQPWNQDWKGNRVYTYKQFLDIRI